MAGRAPRRLARVWLIIHKKNSAGPGVTYRMIAWQATLVDDGAGVRTFGRKGRWKRVSTTPYPSLQAAWPLIRATVRTRLRHHYRIVESG